MVHPYLRRRQGLEPVTYPVRRCAEALERTLGVPIFQEQVIELAMVAAGFSAGEADQLRRAMAAWRRRGGLEHFRESLIEGMLSTWTPARLRRAGLPTNPGRSASTAFPSLMLPASPCWCMSPPG